jgi:hypothetical protein
LAKYESRQHLANKIGWEGGIEGFLDYGFDPDDVPEGDKELEAAAMEMLESWYMFQSDAEDFMKLLPESGDE